jgi:hypothetical protein
MPLDPSIISNAFADVSRNMPDMNALMNQRVRGAENIYQIETARQAQAAEDEKAAAKAQEDAAVKALLPAYAHALKTGDMRGALKFAPPQYQEGLLPYIEALDGKPLEEIQAALTGSLVTSEVGRAFLENQSRVATLGVQQGQLDVSRQDLVLRRQKQALDARGEGEWTWEKGVDANGNPAFAWVNPRTRQVVMADLTGGAAPGTAPGPTPIPAPDVVTPRQPAPGVPATEAASGTTQAPAFRPEPKEGAEKGFNEGEGKSYNFAIRMIDSDAVANELEKEGVLTTDAVTDAVVGAIRALPTVAGGNLSEQIQNALNVVSPTLSPEEQRLAVAQLDFVTAVLRSESGAEIKTSEFPAEYRKYFPVEGDENNPKLLADKKRRRQNAIEGMKTRAGKSGRSQIEDYFSGQGGGAPAATPAPAAPGTSLDGFTFRGVKG